MSNLVRASWVWRIVVSRAWQHLAHLRRSPQLPSRDRKPALTLAGLSRTASREGRDFALSVTLYTVKNLKKKKKKDLVYFFIYVPVGLCT